ncbi:MAG: DUF1566 domain-containing protein [Thiomicrospira sp.]|nr:DUF1566 domain-containing protein [Thiomicrospira sp.]NCN65870.1 DUF1566 domain-containing protein [Thiomicrospira sp.]NCO14866.1 DUF1566 domain-containing protein [Thiomicrospira sp.]NCP57570.1 DUF1566 domain-containing protein [Thiomicrospira sp.]NCS62931.1 DUF1566 domain-containing protein [Thiomicrospira sp.]
MPINHRIRYWLSCVLVIGLAQTAWAQTCKTKNMLAMTPSDEFKSHQNGTVTHLKTGLMWQVCSVGQRWEKGSCQGKANALTWQQALQWPAQVNNTKGYGGYKDWRLPNRKELKSLVEFRCYDPAINLKVFPNTPSDYYWSATPDPESHYGSFGVGFGRGEFFSDYRDDVYQVRLVRTATAP